MFKSPQQFKDTKVFDFKNLIEGITTNINKKSESNSNPASGGSQSLNTKEKKTFDFKSVITNDCTTTPIVNLSIP
jgi:hypothetical protein